VFFAATGITDGELLGGVRYTGHGAETESLVIRGRTGTVRWINAKHNFDKLNPISEIEY
jgi:fructose-1,6-bisphosphatase II